MGKDPDKMKKVLIILIFMSVALCQLLFFSSCGPDFNNPCDQNGSGYNTETCYGCTNECSTNGVKQCSGNGYQVCGNTDADPCWEWGTVTACESWESCSNGECSISCTDECTSGAKQCSGNGYQVCGNTDADPCLEWETVTACGTLETCEDGNCVTITIPVAPSNLQATAVSSSQINLA